MGLEHHIRHASIAIRNGAAEIQGLHAAVGQADGYGFREGLFPSSDSQ